MHKIYPLYVVCCYYSYCTLHTPGLHWQREKLAQVDRALESSPVDITALRKLATSMGGLLHAHTRKMAWPKLVGVNMFAIKPYEGTPLANHKDRAQVLLDVNRCSKRMPNRECTFLFTCTVYLCTLAKKFFIFGTCQNLHHKIFCIGTG